MENFRWYRKFTYGDEYKEQIKHVKSIIDDFYGEVLCDLTTLCELWMAYSEEEFSASFLDPNWDLVERFVDWVKSKEKKERGY